MVLNEGTRTDEEKIQFIFNLLNSKSSDYIEKVKMLLFEDLSPVVRHEAADVFGELEDPKCVDYLIHVIINDPNRFVIHEALLALSTRGNPSTRKIIAREVNNHDKDISDTAVISLQRLDMKSEQIGFDYSRADKLILDPETLWEVRILAAFRLMNECSDESVKVLINAYLYEENPIVKHEIIFALGESASKEAADILACKLTTETNDFVIHESLLAISTLGYTQYCNIISRFQDHEISEIAESAQIALERLHC